MYFKPSRLSASYKKLGSSSSYFTSSICVPLASTGFVGRFSLKNKANLSECPIFLSRVIRTFHAGNTKGVLI